MIGRDLNAEFFSQKIIFTKVSNFYSHFKMFACATNNFNMFVLKIYVINDVNHRD